MHQILRSFHFVESTGCGISRIDWTKEDERYIFLAVYNVVTTSFKSCVADTQFIAIKFQIVKKNFCKLLWSFYMKVENLSAFWTSRSLFITIIFGVYFTILQAYEYVEVSFSIADLLDHPSIRCPVSLNHLPISLPGRHLWTFSNYKKLIF